MGRRPDDVDSSNRTFLHAKQLVVLLFVLFVTFLCFVCMVIFELLPLFLPQRNRGSLPRGSGNIDTDDLPSDTPSGQ